MDVKITIPGCIEDAIDFSVEVMRAAVSEAEEAFRLVNQGGY